MSLFFQASTLLTGGGSAMLREAQTDSTSPDFWESSLKLWCLCFASDGSLHLLTQDTSVCDSRTHTGVMCLSLSDGRVLYDLINCQMVLLHLQVVNETSLNFARLFWVRKVHLLLQPELH